MSHGPIEEQHHQMMNAVAAVLRDAFKGYGFCLLVYDQDSSDGRMNYVCNSRREDMIVAMKEFIAHHEGRVPAAPTARQ
jgi:hypothetical protein